MEDCKSIPKIETNRFPGDTLVAINTEYGAFDNRRDIIPLTEFDETVDRMSPHPGSQIYEKMVAGLYLGELLRVVLFELHKLGILFGGQNISRLEQLNVINASFLQIVEDDITESLGEIHTIFKEQLHLDLNPDELRVCRYLVELIGAGIASLRLWHCSYLQETEHRILSRWSRRVCVPSLGALPRASVTGIAGDS